MEIEFIGEEQACEPENKREQERMGEILPSQLNMIRKTVAELKISDQSFVLEVGFQNIGHHNFLFQQADRIAYFGSSINKDLVQQSATNQAQQMGDNHAQFIIARDSGELDFADGIFDSCFSVNAIYFWKDPLSHLKEICRVLRPGGKFILAFVEEKFGKDLPWTEIDFSFYEQNTVMKFFREAGFGNIREKVMTEQVPGKDRSRPFITISGTRLN